MLQHAPAELDSCLERMFLMPCHIMPVMCCHDAMTLRRQRAERSVFLLFGNQNSDISSALLARSPWMTSNLTWFPLCWFISWVPRSIFKHGICWGAMVGVRSASLPICGPRCFNVFFEEVDGPEDLREAELGMFDPVGQRWLYHELLWYREVRVFSTLTCIHLLHLFRCLKAKALISRWWSITMWVRVAVTLNQRVRVRVQVPLVFGRWLSSWECWFYASLYCKTV